MYTPNGNLASITPDIEQLNINVNNSELARDFSLSRTTIIKQVNNLIEAGYLSKHDNGMCINYSFLHAVIQGTTSPIIEVEVASNRGKTAREAKTLLDQLKAKKPTTTPQPKTKPVKMTETAQDDLNDEDDLLIPLDNIVPITTKTPVEAEAPQFTSTKEIKAFLVDQGCEVGETATLNGIDYGPSAVSGGNLVAWRGTLTAFLNENKEAVA